MVLAKLHGAGEVDQAFGTAASAGRFAENDVIRILTYRPATRSANLAGPAKRAVCYPARPHDRPSDFRLFRPGWVRQATPLRTVPGSAGDPLAEPIQLIAACVPLSITNRVTRRNVRSTGCNEHMAWSDTRVNTAANNE